MRLLVIAIVALAAAGGRPRPRAAVEAGLGDGMGEDAERAGGDESDYDDKEEGSTSLAWSNMHICLDNMRYGQATLTEGIAVMSSFSDKFAGRIENLLALGAPLPRRRLRGSRKSDDI